MDQIYIDVYYMGFLVGPPLGVDDSDGFVPTMKVLGPLVRPGGPRGSACLTPPGRRPWLPRCSGSS